MQVQSLGGEDPWRKARTPTPVLLPEEPHGHRSLAGYSPWDCKVRHDLVTMQQTTTIIIYGIYLTWNTLTWFLSLQTQCYRHACFYRCLTPPLLPLGQASMRAHAHTHTCTHWQSILYNPLLKGCRAAQNHITDEVEKFSLRPSSHEEHLNLGSLKKKKMLEPRWKRGKFIRTLPYPGFFTPLWKQIHWPGA